VSDLSRLEFDVGLPLALWVGGFLLQLAIAGWVLVLAPREPLHRAFAALFGANAVWDLLWGIGKLALNPATEAFFLRLVGYSIVPTCAALLVFLSYYPERRFLAKVPFAFPALAAASAVALAVHALAVPFWHHVLRNVLDLLWFPVLLGAAVALGLAEARRPPAGRDPSRLLVGAAFTLYPNWVFLEIATGSYVPTNPTEPLEIVPWAIHMGTFVAAAVYAFLASVAWRIPSTGRGTAILLALVYAGLLASVAFELSGVVSILFGAIPAYALARHRLFDIDVRLRWGLSRGAVAGVILAAFFVVSQLAEAYFSDEVGGFAGAAIVGLLLFSITPLQRAAERFASAAVPGRTPAEASRGSTRLAEDAYRRALRLALRDRVLTRDEERELALLAHDLGLPPARAFALRDEVEAAKPAA